MRRIKRGLPPPALDVVSVDALLSRLYARLLRRHGGAVATVLAVSVEAPLRRFAERSDCASPPPPPPGAYMVPRTVAAEGRRRRGRADGCRWRWLRQSRQPRDSNECLKLSSGDRSPGDGMRGALSSWASRMGRVAVDFFCERYASQSEQPAGSSGFGGGVGAAGVSVRLSLSRGVVFGDAVLVESEMGIMRRSAPWCFSSSIGTMSTAEAMRWLEGDMLNRAVGEPEGAASLRSANEVEGSGAADTRSMVDVEDARRRAVVQSLGAYLGFPRGRSKSTKDRLGSRPTLYNRTISRQLIKTQSSLT